MSMRARFIGEELIADTGEVINISFEDLKKACLNSGSESLSILEIICEGVRIYTGGYNIVRGKHHESSLYSKLEWEIFHDEKYQARKNKRYEERHQLSEASRIEKEKRNRSYGENKYVLNKIRKKMKAYYA